MSNDTRRFGPDDQPDRPTQRLDEPNATRCIRCGSAMEPTRAFTEMADYRTLKLSARDPHTSAWSRNAGVSMRTMTCLNCGYTEFYADDLPTLVALLRENNAVVQREVDRRQREYEEEQRILHPPRLPRSR